MTSSARIMTDVQETVAPASVVSTGAGALPDGGPAVRTPAILHVLAGSDYGGGSVVVRDIASAAAGSGFRVSVLTTDPRLAIELRERGVTVVDDIVVERRMRPLADVVSLVRLTKHLHHTGYDVVHTHTSKGGLVGRLAAVLARVPVVIHTAHGFSFHEYPSRLQRRPFRARACVLAERALASLTDIVVTVSEYHRSVATVERLAPRQRLVAIVNGIRDPRPQVPATGSPGGPTRSERHRKLTLLCFGRLSTQKGIHHLLSAMALLEPSLRDRCRLQLAGAGELAAHLQSEVRRLGLEDVVDFLGFRSDVEELVENADIVVLPSLWEGLSIALLEALAAGKPVVATAIPSNVEVVGDSRCAVLVPPADPGALADAITTLVRSPSQRQRLAVAARLRYESSYGVTRMCQEYIALYQEALAA
jgi:glycosyltransferase involved in cell wall biosynthesis